MAPQTANPKTDAALTILRDAHARGEFSGCALAFRHGTEGLFWQHGTLSRADSSPVGPQDFFDLASLTKIFSTGALLLQLESEDRLQLNDPITRWIPEFPDPTVTLRMLLEHRSGLPAHVEFFRRFSAGEAPMGDQRALRYWICEVKTDPARPQVYSDLGFMLLGFVVEKICGAALPEAFAERIAKRLKLQRTGFRLLPHAPSHSPSLPDGRFVATENCPWRGRVMQGEVHDDNCWTMGGYGGHAGLFSTAEESLRLLEHTSHLLRAHPDLFPVGTSTGFHAGFMVYPGLRPFPDAGFPGAVGHTGFTGTSAWWHPEKDLRVVLLTNRVHPSRDDGRFIDTRLRFHQALWRALA